VSQHPDEEANPGRGAPRRKRHLPETHEFNADEVRNLLSELDQRLRDRGVAAAVFVVGGAAVAATGIRDGRLTQDVDAISGDRVVIDEARAMAAERGLPENWLNPNARMWMPPLPAGVLDPPDQPGLRVTFADDPFLLATKLIAQRAKDLDDLVALAKRVGVHATATELEAHIRAYYTDRDQLELILDGTDPDAELPLLAQEAAAVLNRRPGPPDMM
jgi:hypothetical protein